MPESHLYHLWESHAATGASFTCKAGERLVVISRGERNNGPGPDYLGAVLVIDGEMRAGAVEMHCREEEWFEHGHDRDAAYNQVILHVVGEAGAGPEIPVLERERLEGERLGREGDWGERETQRGSRELGMRFLAELAWTRLLRRVTEIVRSEPEYDIEDRIRRAFVRRLFDALGYAANRDPMREAAEIVLAREPEMASVSFLESAARIFRASGMEMERIVEVGGRFLDTSSLLKSLDNCDLPGVRSGWRYDTRPANAPERRLWGAARLLFEIYRHDLPGRLRDAVAAASAARVVEMFVVRLGDVTVIGPDRAREIVVNGAIPAMLAWGIMRDDRRTIEGACRLYREMPSTGSNLLVRSVEKRYLQGERLRGGFWQQGAIEFHQRYLAPDRSRLSFVAESPGRQGLR